MKNTKNSFLILFCISFYLFANQNVLNWDSMTSMINPTSIIKGFNDDIIATTSGGLLVLNNDEFYTLKDNLNNLNLSIIGLDNYGFIWVGGSYPNGNIQVLDNNYNLILLNHWYMGIHCIFLLLLLTDNQLKQNF